MSFRYNIKKGVYTGKIVNPDDLYSIIKDYDYISFDLFDTLVKRNIEEPQDVFDIVELSVGAGFKNKRITAEEKAREKSEFDEITLDEIYEYYDGDNRELIKGIEIETEINCIAPNLPLKEVYERCIKNGKTVFITSDMYLDESTIRRILEKTGFCLYKSVYLSSTYRCLKKDGALFKVLMERERIGSEQLIHVGDDIRGDYFAPKKLGIRAVRIPRYTRRISFRGSGDNSTIQRNYLNHFINNTFNGNPDPYYQFGYALFGKLLYGYVNWIHGEVKKRGIKKLFFFSRDGYIMKQAYEVCFHDDEIDTEYLEVSRRSLRVPILWQDCSVDTILTMLINAKLITLKSIFDGIGLEIEDYAALISKHGLTQTSEFDKETIRQDKHLRNLLIDLQSEIVSNSVKEFENLKLYLEEHGVEGKLGVVDIGHLGSMQRYLQQALTALHIGHQITGFYMGVSDTYKKNELSGVPFDINGYLCDFKHDSNAVDMIHPFVCLFETLFLEQDGSAKRYVQSESGVVCERYPYEYKESKYEIEKIRQLQKGAMDFIVRAADDPVLPIVKPSQMDVFSGLYEFGTDPSMNDVNMFGDMKFFDEGEEYKLAAPKSIFYYVLQPRQAKIDLLKCRWKIGFLKRLLKIKLPYLAIYEKLRTFG